MLVRESMIDKVVSVHPETGLHEARRLLRTYNVRRLPVIVEGRLVGIVTNRDLRQASPSPATTLAVHELNHGFCQVVDLPSHPMPYSPR